MTGLFLTMKTVKIVKNWDEPNLLRQTPGGQGVWNSVHFTLQPLVNCDYLLVLNFIPDDLRPTRPTLYTWAMMQEPHIPGKFDWVVDGHERFDRVFSHVPMTDNDKYLDTQTCLPWHIDKTYDELILLSCPKKTKRISWITSNKRTFPGHKLRMDFFDHIVRRVDLKLDVFGYGINPVRDKWDGLAPYKYSLAVENSSSMHYWTEKVADCFLSYCLPFYSGCINLGDYFPKESYIEIDIKNVEKSVDIIKSAISSNQWKKRLGAIMEARELVLNKYQLFPFVENQIEQFED